jgi:MFS transporter, SP family, inositol transporter
VTTTASGPSGRGKIDRRAWRTAALGGMASYMDAATIVSTGTALVLFQKELGLSAWSIGALSAALTLCLAVGAFFGGRLGDLVGRRTVYTLDLLVYAAGLAVLVGAVNQPMLYVGVVVVGLAMGADIPTSLALIGEEAPEGQRGRLVAFSQALWVTGIAAANIIAFLISDLGSLGARILYGHLLVVSLGVWLLRRSMRESAEWVEARDAQRNASVLDGADPLTSLRADSTRRLLRRPLLAALVATGLYYSIGNLAANTFGQFKTYLVVNVAGASVGTATLIGLGALPLGLGGSLIFMRVVDRRTRLGWFTFGAVLLCAAATVPLVFGFNLTTLIILAFGFGFGGPFAGEGIYKVWSQELFPTLLRGTAQGLTFAVARVLAAAFALVTPAIAKADPQALVAILLLVSVVSGLIGGLWLPRLERGARRTEMPTSVAGDRRPINAEETL